MVGVQTAGSKADRGVMKNQGCVDISQPSPILSFFSLGGCWALESGVQVQLVVERLYTWTEGDLRKQWGF